MEASDLSSYVLRVTSPQGSGVHRLPRGRTIIGRSAVGDPDIAIGDVLAAPRHCVLDWDPQLACHRLTVWGVNGVSVNGMLVIANAESRPLSAGDELRIGQTSLWYELTDGTPRARAG